MSSGQRLSSRRARRPHTALPCPFRPRVGPILTRAKESPHTEISASDPLLQTPTKTTAQISRGFQQRPRLIFLASLSCFCESGADEQNQKQTQQSLSFQLIWRIEVQN